MKEIIHFKNIFSKKTRLQGIDLHYANIRSNVENYVNMKTRL